MTGLEASTEAPEPYSRPLYVSIELAANLVYLLRQADVSGPRQNDYLEQLAALLAEMREHPTVKAEIQP